MWALWLGLSGLSCLFRWRRDNGEMYDMMGLHGPAILYTIMYNHYMLQATCQADTSRHSSCSIYLLCSPRITASLHHVVFRPLGPEWEGKKNVLFCLNNGHAGTDTPVSYATTPIVNTRTIPQIKTSESTSAVHIAVLLCLTSTPWSISPLPAWIHTTLHDASRWLPPHLFTIATTLSPHIAARSRISSPPLCCHPGAQLC